MEKKTPKEYLRQLRTAEIKIEQKEEELERLKSSLESISTGTDSETPVLKWMENHIQQFVLPVCQCHSI